MIGVPVLSVQALRHEMMTVQQALMARGSGVAHTMSRGCEPCSIGGQSREGACGKAMHVAARAPWTQGILLRLMEKACEQSYRPVAGIYGSRGLNSHDVDDGLGR